MSSSFSVFKLCAQFFFLAVLCSALTVVLSAAANPCFTSAARATGSITSSEQATAFKVVLDAGHGGEDGGASADGILEKDLNLEITESLAELFSVFGADVTMTRTDDKMLYDYYGDLDDYTGMKKIYDLKNRVRIAKEADADLFLSIHMNSFPSSTARGVQVYYASAYEESKNTAEKLRGYIKLYLQEFNNRGIKDGRGIFLLERAPIPALLIECGFLTNHDDLTLLQSEDYVSKLSACIVTATLYSQ